MANTGRRCVTCGKFRAEHKSVPMPSNPGWHTFVPKERRSTERRKREGVFLDRSVRRTCGPSGSCTWCSSKRSGQDRRGATSEATTSDICERLDWWEYYYGCDRPLSQRRPHPYFVADPDGFDESAIEIDMGEAATEIRGLRDLCGRLADAIDRELPWMAGLTNQDESLRALVSQARAATRRGNG